MKLKVFLWKDLEIICKNTKVLRREITVSYHGNSLVRCGCKTKPQTTKSRCLVCVGVYLLKLTTKILAKLFFCPYKLSEITRRVLFKTSKSDASVIWVNIFEFIFVINKKWATWWCVTSWRFLISNQGINKQDNWLSNFYLNEALSSAIFLFNILRVIYSWVIRHVLSTSYVASR